MQTIRNTGNMQCVRHSSPGPAQPSPAKYCFHRANNHAFCRGTIFFQQAKLTAQP